MREDARVQRHRDAGAGRRAGGLHVSPVPVSRTDPPEHGQHSGRGRSWRLLGQVVLVLVVVEVLRRLLSPNRVQTFARVPGSKVVLADDGVELYAEEDGDPAGDLTVVFAHGYECRLDCFDAERARLRAETDVRMIFYDQRGHGRSGWGDLTRATIDQLGRDMAQVLDAEVPSGPIVLVGHSMGGMTIMALAQQQPELFGSRVVGVGLLSTSAGELIAPFRRVLRFLSKPGVLAIYLRLVALLSPFWIRWRRVGTRRGYIMHRWLQFGREEHVTAEQVRRIQAMLEATAPPVAAAFAPTFISHDKTSALATLRPVPVLVVAGTNDKLTPLSHAEALVRETEPDTEFIVVPHTGHWAIVTSPDVVTDGLTRLVSRSRARLLAA
jgi:pimeloyl-ACP methyl ester carboxylesterase